MTKTRLERLKGLLKENPEDSFLIFAIAKEYEKQGDEAQALEHYLKLRKQDPDYVGTYYHLGKAYERRGDPERASEVYEAGMEAARRAGDQHALSELAGAKLNLGGEEG
jgi:tetratricopeptide (TPR) repeat protein